MKRHVVIAIPAHAGTIHLGTMRSIIHDLIALMKRGDTVQVEDECGSAEIADARARLVGEFLSSKGTDLVFVDSDVCWEPGALVKLVDTPVDLIAGVYPRRSDPIKFSLRFLNDGDELKSSTGNPGLIEVAGVSAGFMRCSRRMLERMSESYSDLLYYREGRTYCGFFDPYRTDDGKRRLSEDYSFCQRWKDIGGSVWIDPAIKMGHVGYKTFMGSLGHFMKEAERNVQDR